MAAQLGVVSGNSVANLELFDFLLLVQLLTPREAAACTTGLPAQQQRRPQWFRDLDNERVG